MTAKRPRRDVLGSGRRHRTAEPCRGTAAEREFAEVPPRERAAAAATFLARRAHRPRHRAPGRLADSARLDFESRPGRGPATTRSARIATTSRRGRGLQTGLALAARPSGAARVTN